MRNKSSGELSFPVPPLLLASLHHQVFLLPLPPPYPPYVSFLPELGMGSLGYPSSSPPHPTLLTALASSLFQGALGEEVQL